MVALSTPIESWGHSVSAGGALSPSVRSRAQGEAGICLPHSFSSGATAVIYKALVSDEEFPASGMQ